MKFILEIKVCFNIKKSINKKINVIYHINTFF